MSRLQLTTDAPSPEWGAKATEPYAPDSERVIMCEAAFAGGEFYLYHIPREWGAINARYCVSCGPRDHWQNDRPAFYDGQDLFKAYHMFSSLLEEAGGPLCWPEDWKAQRDFREEIWAYRP